MSGALAGKCVLVTRPKHQAEAAIRELEALGATVFAVPAIEIQPPESFEPLDGALRMLESYDWVVLTSVNGVRATAARMEELGISPSSLEGRKLAAIGPATAAEMERFFRAPDLVPAEYVSEAIAEAMPDIEDQRFLLARADIARRDLAHLLRERGAVVDEVCAYRIVPSDGMVDLPSKRPDFITLTSAASARATYDLLKSKGLGDWMVQSRLVTIGPITSATVRDLGFEVAAEAEEFTVPGMIRAIIEDAQKEPAHA